MLQIYTCELEKLAEPCLSSCDAPECTVAKDNEKGLICQHLRSIPEAEGSEIFQSKKKISSFADSQHLVFFSLLRYHKSAA